MTEFDRVTYGPRRAAEDEGLSVTKAAVGQWPTVYHTD